MLRAWFPKGKTPVIKDVGSFEKFSVFGAYSKNKDRLIVRTSTFFNAVSFKKFIEHLLKRVRLRKKKILLVLDNARYHKAKALIPFFERIKDRLELLFLPPYSPDLNPIEIEWREARRHVTHNRYFETAESQKEAIIDYWNENKNTRKKDIFTAMT